MREEEEEEEGRGRGGVSGRKVDTNFTFSLLRRDSESTENFV